MSEEDNSKYSIGQVVYILSSKGQTIIPAMIVEQVTIKTLNGEDVSWKLAIGKANDPTKPQKIIESSNIDGEIYSSLNNVRSIMTKKLNDFVDNVIGQANKRTTHWYGKQIEILNKKPKPQPQNNVPEVQAIPQKPSKIDPEDLLSDYDKDIHESDNTGNGNQMMMSSLPTSKPKINNIREHLKSLVVPNDEEFDEYQPVESIDQQSAVQHNNQTDNNGQGKMIYITGPNGEKFPINSEDLNL